MVAVQFVKVSWPTQAFMSGWNFSFIGNIPWQPQGSTEAAKQPHKTNSSRRFIIAASFSLVQGQSE
jgi:hypothetical protein